MKGRNNFGRNESDFVPYDADRRKRGFHLIPTNEVDIDHVERGRAASAVRGDHVDLRIATDEVIPYRKPEDLVEAILPFSIEEANIVGRQRAKHVPKTGEDLLDVQERRSPGRVVLCSVVEVSQIVQEVSVGLPHTMSLESIDATDEVCSRRHMGKNDRF